MPRQTQPDARQRRDLFQRLTVVHRPDCTALSQPAPTAAAAALPDEDEVARILGSDAAGRYGVEARAVYEDLRRLIGQRAGLLILARLTARRDTGELPEIAACRERLAFAQTALARLSAPGPLAAHHAMLDETTAQCAAILSGLLHWHPTVPVPMPVSPP